MYIMSHSYKRFLYAIFRKILNVCCYVLYILYDSRVSNICISTNVKMINNNNHRKNTRWSIFSKNYKTLRDLIVMQISMTFVIRKYEF